MQTHIILRRVRSVGLVLLCAALALALLVGCRAEQQEDLVTVRLSEVTLL